MPSFRFCRPDTIPLLVQALNQCYRPHFPGDAEFTIERFRQAMKEMDVWPSNSMVAIEGDDPIAVIVGTKREHEVLIRWLGVAPGHEHRGHGSHLVMSLSHKLAVLGPPRLVAEVPEDNEAAIGMFESLGFEREVVLGDWFLPSTATPAEPEGPRPIIRKVVVPKEPVSVLPHDLVPRLRPAISWHRSPETVSQAAERLEGWRDDQGAWILLDPTTWPVRVSAMDGEAPFSLLHALGAKIEYGLLLPRLAESEFSSDRLEKEGLAPLRRYWRMTADAIPA